MEIQVRVSALDKMVDYIGSGIGSVAALMFARWIAKREAEAKIIGARGDAEVLEIKGEAQARVLPTLGGAYEELRNVIRSDKSTVEAELTVGEVIEQKVRFQEARRLGNISSVIDKALDSMSDDEVPDSEPDHDWTARFFDYIQDVSSEEMHRLWGKVLAGEVERPGSTSIRSLAILRDLDRQTAEAFRRLCSLSVSMKVAEGQFIDSRVLSLHGSAAGNSLQEYGLSFGVLNVLNEHGLIIADYNSWSDYQLCVGIELPVLPGQRMRLPFSYRAEEWVLDAVGRREGSKELKLYGVALTKSGQELSRVVELESISSYDKALRDYFASKGLTMTRVSDR